MRISDKDDLCEVREAMKLVIANYRLFLSFYALDVVAELDLVREFYRIPIW